MAKRKPLTNAAGEVRELHAADLARGANLSTLPRSLQGRLRKIGERGPQKTPTKKLVSLRLSPEVLAHYKASGPGWQTRIDQVLKRAVARAR